MATTKILIPTPLRPYTDKQEAVEAHGATIGELLADLTKRHSGLKAHLYNEQGKLRSFVYVYLNDEDIRYPQYSQRTQRKIWLCDLRVLRGSEWKP
jgi:adenylyltransferase/sulfurtransferase